MPRLILPLALLLVGVASAQDKTKEDDEALRGTWTVTKAEEDGKPLKELDKAKFTFRAGGKMLIVHGDGDKVEVTFKVDTSKMPRQIDVQKDGGDAALGIYEVKGDTLRLCVSERDAKARPAE